LQFSAEPLTFGSGLESVRRLYRRLVELSTAGGRIGGVACQRQPQLASQSARRGGSRGRFEPETRIEEALRSTAPTPAPPPGQATALALPTRKATAGAASLRFGLARGSLRARFGRRAAAPLSAPREKTVIEVYGTTFARVEEIKRGMLVRRLAGFQVVVDVHSIEGNSVRLRLDDGGTITLGPNGLVEVAR
jgi:hypothetical protein